MHNFLENKKPDRIGSDLLAILYFYDVVTSPLPTAGRPNPYPFPTDVIPAKAGIQFAKYGFRIKSGMTSKQE